MNVVEGGAAAAEGIECATVMVKELQYNTRRKGHHQGNANVEKCHRNKKKENYNSYCCGGSLLRREGRRVCPWGWRVLPSQSTKDHMHRSRTIEIGRQKQRVVHV